MITPSDCPQWQTDRDPAQAGDHPGPTASYTTSWDTIHVLLEIDVPAPFWPHLAAAPAPTAERRMKPCLRHAVVSGANLRAWTKQPD
jgi:hypothetical protein